MGILNKNGAFAEYITLPIENLHIVPNCISDEEACFIEPLAAAYRIIEQGLIQKEDHVAIIGDGKLGLLIAEILSRQISQNKISLIGKHMEKLSLLGSAIIPILLDQGTGYEHQDCFDVTIESSGSSDGFKLACLITKPLGKIIMKTTCSEEKLKNLSLNEVVIKEQMIIGSRCGPFEPAIKLLEEKKINVKKYISKVFELKDMEEAFEYASMKGVLKVQVVI